MIARPCVPEGWSSGAQRPGILEGWIGEMANDDHVEVMVAQTCDDVSVMTGQWATRVAWSVCVGCPCAQPYWLVSYLYYFTTSSIVRANAMFYEGKSGVNDDGGGARGAVDSGVDVRRGGLKDDPNNIIH
jgi:hypothetical protein